jgi:DNA polymerase III subunit delta
VRLKAAQVDGFLARPRPEVATVLLYGPDAGLVAERAKALALKVVDALDDPFRVSELDPDLLDREPGRLVEEAQALTLMGGRRLVRVRDADERVAKACKQLLALADQAGFVVMEGGELAGSSRLRRMVEESPKAAALPCFRADERAMPAFVRETLGELGLRAEGEAVAYLATHLGGDRAVTRRELEKLALYLHDQPEPRVVRLKDAAAVVGDSDAVEVDDMVRAALLGDQPRLERALDRLLGEGANPSSLLRACVRTLNQALRLRAEAAAPGGKTVSAALAPMHFRTKELLEAVLRDWSADRLLEALARLQGAEIRSRQAKAPAELICREALAGLAGR